MTKVVPNDDAATKPTLVASCNNCTSFVDGRCAFNVSLSPGKLLCERYSITDGFRDAIVEVMMGDIWKQMKSTADRVSKMQAARRLWN